MKKETYKQILDRVSQYAKTKFPNGKFDFSSLGKYANAAKALTVTNLVGELPGVKSLVTKVNDTAVDLETKLFNVTLGKIPGVGKILRNLNDGLMEFNKNVLEGLNLRTERVNHPSFWTQLGVHNTFSIPSGYTNQSNALNWVILNNVPSVATINIVDNPVPNFEATKMQLTQLRSLLKAVRGLSNLSYDIADLLTYSINVEACLKLYYKTLKAVNIATQHALSKPNIPKAIVQGLDIDYNDLIANLANYQQFLNVMYGYLNKNFALPHEKWKRIKALSMCYLGDNSKLSNSTIYQFNYSTIFNAGARNTQLSVNSFRKGSPYHTLTTIRDLFNTIVTSMQSETMSNITADLIGAFGESVIFNDTPKFDYKLTISKDMDLLNALKNGDLQDYSLSAYTTEGKGLEFVFTQYASTQVVMEDDSNVVWTPEAIMAQDTNTAFKTEIYPSDSKELDINNISIILPRNGGIVEAGKIELTVGQTKLFTPVNNKTISMDKLSLNEGEALELLQFASTLKSMSVNKLSTNVPVLNIVIANCYTVIEQITVDYYGQDAYRDATIQHFSDYDAYTDIQKHELTPTLWSLVDWLPRLDYVKYRNNTDAGRNMPIILWDLAATGFVSLEARRLATYYQTYSQLSIANTEPTTDKYNAKTYSRK